MPTLSTAARIVVLGLALTAVTASNAAARQGDVFDRVSTATPCRRAA